MKVHFCVYLIVWIVGSSQILLNCVWPFKFFFFFFFFFFFETNLKFYPLFYNHNIILFISLRLNVLDFNISAFLFKIQMHL